MVDSEMLKDSFAMSVFKPLLEGMVQTNMLADPPVIPWEYATLLEQLLQTNVLADSLTVPNFFKNLGIVEELDV